MALQGHPRSLILAPVESAYAISYRSFLGPILHRFRDIASFPRRATALLFHPNFRGVPLGLDCRRCGSKERRPYANYLRQVNEVNGGDNAFVRCVSCLSVCVCEATGQWELNANISKTIKAMDFKFGTSVPRDSPDMTPKNLSKRGCGHGHVTA